jgi:hypothetical protein
MRSITRKVETTEGTAGGLTDSLDPGLRPKGRRRRPPSEGLERSDGSRALRRPGRYPVDNRKA